MSVSARAGHPGHWASRAAWSLLGLIAVVALVIGADHPGTESRASRVAYLESIIKCPSCVDVSIAQSSAEPAIALRTKVTGFVDAGWSDAAIENWVNARYGTNEILTPPASGLDVLAWILPLVGLGAGVAVLGALLYRRRARRPGAAFATDDEALVAEALDEHLGAGR